MNDHQVSSSTSTKVIASVRLELPSLLEVSLMIKSIRLLWVPDLFLHQRAVDE